MVMTGSQETSECNGSAGSPQYGFMKRLGWWKDRSIAPVFHRPRRG